MELFHTALEAHPLGATIYITGFLTADAATRVAELMVGMQAETRVVRLDIRAVQVIDPVAFVRIARTLSRWRDVRRGRVTIEFPERAKRRKEERVLEQAANREEQTDARPPIFGNRAARRAGA